MSLNGFDAGHPSPSLPTCAAPFANSKAPERHPQLLPGISVPQLSGGTMGGITAEFGVGSAV